MNRTSTDGAGDNARPAPEQDDTGAHDRVDGGSAETAQALDFDDDEIYSGRGNNARRGGTANAAGGDSGDIAPPSEQLSRSNEPRERRP